MDEEHGWTPPASGSRWSGRSRREERAWRWTQLTTARQKARRYGEYLADLNPNAGQVDGTRDAEIVILVSDGILEIHRRLRRYSLLFNLMRSRTKKAAGKHDEARIALTQAHAARDEAKREMDETKRPRVSQFVSSPPIRWTATIAGFALLEYALSLKFWNGVGFDPRTAKLAAWAMGLALGILAIALGAGWAAVGRQSDEENNTGSRTYRRMLAALVGAAVVAAITALVILGSERQQNEHTQAENRARAEQIRSKPIARPEAGQQAQDRRETQTTEVQPVKSLRLLFMSALQVALLLGGMTVEALAAPTEEYRERRHQYLLLRREARRATRRKYLARVRDLRVNMPVDISWALAWRVATTGRQEILTTLQEVRAGHRSRLAGGIVADVSLPTPPSVEQILRDLLLPTPSYLDREDGWTRPGPSSFDREETIRESPVADDASPNGGSPVGIRLDQPDANDPTGDRHEQDGDPGHPRDMED